MALTTMSISSEAQPFYGFVETTGDALRLIQAARLGVIPRVNRRLNDAERRSMVRSGAVFIFSVEESGIRRWTEGLLWSASRIVGNFLVYREVTERGSGRASYGKSYAQGPQSSRRLSHLPPDQRSRIKFEKSLVGSLLDHHGRFKEEGLIKKTITVSVAGRDHHLVSYYKKEDIESGRLSRPVARADLREIDIPSEMLESTTFRYPPKVEVNPEGKLQYVRDADEPDQTPLSATPRRRFSSDAPKPSISRPYGRLEDSPSEPSVFATSCSLPTSWLPSTRVLDLEYTRTEHSPLKLDFPQSPVQGFRSGHSMSSPHMSSSGHLFPSLDSSDLTSTTYQHSASHMSAAPSSWSIGPYGHHGQIHGGWNSDPQLYARNTAGIRETLADANPISSSPTGSIYSAPSPPRFSHVQESQPYASSSPDSAQPFVEPVLGRVMESSYHMAYYPHSTDA